MASQLEYGEVALDRYQDKKYKGRTFMPNIPATKAPVPIPIVPIETCS